MHVSTVQTSCSSYFSIWVSHAEVGGGSDTDRERYAMSQYRRLHVE